VKIVGHVSGKDLIEDISAVKRVSSLGIGVEVQLTSEVIDRFTYKEFCRIRKSVGRNCLTVHAPFIDLNPGSLEPYVLEATRKRFSETVLIAKALGAEVIVFHSGYHPQKVNPFYGAWFKRAVETFEFVLSEWDGKIAIENVFDETPENLENFMRELPERVGVCLDVGHLNLFSRVPLEEWFDRLGDRIYEFHVHDNFGVSDDHLPMGKGNVDFNVFFKLLENVKTDYVFNLENKTTEGISESLEFLRRKAYGKGNSHLPQRAFKEEG